MDFSYSLTRTIRELSNVIVIADIYTGMGGSFEYALKGFQTINHECHSSVNVNHNDRVWR